MVDQIIRPSALPRRTNPVASEIVPVDNGVQVAGSTLAEIVDAGAPVASRSEAEAGVNNTKRMTPLTVDQKIEYEIGRSLASNAQGALADTAVQPEELSLVATTGNYDDLSNQPEIPPGLTDGDKGDVTVSGSGLVWTLNRALSYPESGGVNYDADARKIINLIDGDSPSDAATARQARGLDAGAISIPSGFNWPSNAAQFVGRQPFTIFRRINGIVDCNFSLSYPPTLIEGSGGTNTYYVAASGGNDSNNGTTPQTPLATIDAALNKSGCRRVILQPGQYLNSWTITPPSSQTLIEVADGGRARIITGVVPSTWTSVGSGIYSGNVSASPAVVTVVNDRQSDEFGFPLALPRYADLAALQAETGPGFAHVGGTIYIRLRDDGGGYPVPGSNEIIVTTRGTGPRVNSGSRYIFKGLERWGGDFAFEINSQDGFTSTAFVQFEDCDFAYAYADGLSVWNGRGGVVSRRCRAFRNGRDGFNYHDRGTNFRTMAFEIDCVGLAAGFGTTHAGDGHQGSSNHDNGRVIRINGVYGAGRGGDIVDIGDSMSWNVNCAAIGSRAVDASNRNGFETQNNAKIWLDGCTAYGNPSGLMARGTSQISIRNLLNDGDRTESGGTIAPY